MKIRENLSSFLMDEQSVISEEWSANPLRKEFELAYGTILRKDNRPIFYMTNEKLFNRFCWCEFMRVMAQMEIEFTDANEVKELFRKFGIDTRSDDVWEMYMGGNDLLCNYSFQVNMNSDSPLLMAVRAYVK